MNPVLPTVSPRTRGRGRSATRLAATSLAAALVVSGATVAAPGAAWAADPFSPTALYGTVTGERVIYEVDPVAGTAAPLDLTVPDVGTGNINQIGLSADGDLMMLTDGTTVYRYSASSEEWASAARDTGPGVTTTMGGVDPQTGYLFYGGRGTGSSFTFARYDPATNTILPGVITVDAPDAPGNNGDLVFDGQGNMYFVAGAGAGATSTGQLYRVDAADLDSTETVTATPLGGAIQAGGVNSISFGSDGYLYLYGSSTFFQIHPSTGATVEERAFATALTDLGSRALPFTARLVSTIPDGDRYEDGDNFSIELGGGGITVGNTDGTDGGDTAVVGPVIILPDETYTIEQVPAPGTDPRDYTTTWECVGEPNGTPVASGTGSSGEFVVPAGVTDVTCSFVNVAKDATSATDDASLGNTQGSTVALDVLANDEGVDLQATSVRIVGADGALVTELVVTGQGAWTVDPVTGAIAFAPEPGFSGNPTPITYEVADDRDNTTRADVVVTYVPAAVDDTSLGNTPGSPVTLGVLDNDLGDLDPTTVRILGAEGDLVTELVVDGQGTWTVDPVTGAITFTPEPGFLVNPTPIAYQVTDRSGITTPADVVVAYLPTAADDASLGNAQGQTVTLDVVGNDLGDLDPTTVRILGSEGELVTELVVDGQGTWTVDGMTGAITFTPAAGFSGNPTPIGYQVTDLNGSTATADVVVTYVPAAADDVSLDNAQGQTVVVDVLGNDLGDLDPTTVRIVGPEGELVTELVVDGQGTWTVDPVTGAISFTPEPGFSGDPTPVTYQVTDLTGLSTQALVTVTYLTSGEPVVPVTPSAPAAASALAVTGSAVFWVVAAGLAASVAGASLLLVRRRLQQD